MLVQNFVKLYERGFRENWDLPALSDFSTQQTLYYKDLAREIARVHILLKGARIEHGDKIALIGKNNIPWCVAYLATVTYGAVIVPILQDFHPDNLEHIIDHSDAKLLFIDSVIWKKIEDRELPQVDAVFSTDTLDFNCLRNNTTIKLDNTSQTLDERMKELYPEGFNRQDIQYATVHNSEIVLINYTSGTTGSSKGVMITANNLAGNLAFARYQELLFRGENILSFLPLAHAYGAAFEFLFALSEGCHTTLLGKKPSPQILMKAFAEVKPKLIVSVPLIIEKIYKNAILPQIDKPSVKLLLKLPIIRRRVYSKIQQSLFSALGGNFREVVVGGAALNPDVESFLRKINFPFTVGYGMTECAPLISYEHHTTFVSTSCGRILKHLMEIRVDSKNPYKVAGEIHVRGENTMIGYYKNEEATKASFTEDGWLRTGDMGIVDEQRRIYLRGRCKTMLLSSNGQNIYPEEVEAKLANLPFVGECLVVQRGGKLTALVYPDYEELKASNIPPEKILAIMEKNRQILNTQVASYERVLKVEIQQEEFEKTPKNSIRRYLYES